jgi:hypothetical protein
MISTGIESLADFLPGLGGGSKGFAVSVVVDAPRLAQLNTLS